MRIGEGKPKSWRRQDANRNIRYEELTNDSLKLVLSPTASPAILDLEASSTALLFQNVSTTSSTNQRQQELEKRLKEMEQEALKVTFFYSFIILDCVPEHF